MDHTQALNDLEEGAKLIGPALRFLESENDSAVLKEVHNLLNQACEKFESEYGYDIGHFNTLSGGGPK